MPAVPTRPNHVVVDGSNIATEGRTHPSLGQLDEAVRAFIEEHPHDVVTVVVDATFGHRIDPSEVPAFDAAVENNELVTPPAGAIGRGDAFVLTIANKAGAAVLSNDSFQEFHADYPWLFDEGRLIGGKPVPHVGWVFVARTPVRGPVSRRALREAKKTRTPAGGRPSKLASQPMPVPKAPPPGRKAPAGAGTAASAPEAVKAKAGTSDRRKAPVEVIAAPVAPVPAKAAAPAPAAPAPTKQTAINELLPFLEFVERAPVGTPVDAVVESFSSHGAYVTVDGVRCYVPLRYLASPAPKSAREVLTIGETRGFVVVSFNPSRRGIDVALPELVPAGIEIVTKPAPVRAKRATKRPTKKAAPTSDVIAPSAPAAKRVRKAPAKAPASPAVSTEVEQTTPAPPAKVSRGRGAKAAPATKVTKATTTTTKTAAKRATAAKATKAPAAKKAAKAPAGAPTEAAADVAAEPAIAKKAKRARKVTTPSPSA